MVLGLSRLLIIHIRLMIRRRHQLRGARWQRILSDSLSWALPVRHMVRGAIALTMASFVFHLGIIIVPLLLPDHIALWERVLGVDLPQIGFVLADTLTLAAVACGLVLLGNRIMARRARSLSRASDYMVLILVTMTMATGYMAAHAAANPLPWSVMMLIHMLSAEALFVVVPFSKLSHVVLFPFERLSQAYWRLQPGAGEEIARALWGEEAHI
jgi:nitrate reductase gamma subunit